ncbi:hypothetical protein [Filimonas effusa]|uniref:Uncharacterized protein n=1 Tax=Filimonas effusa TaxID=2508721 RepID=A0A4Q1D908_9BACT|nr:hypothetical protein [Filimonas effusa]RXK85854.1 hypothetical protein ESB13_03325 [Filimonas effusa]
MKNEKLKNLVGIIETSNRSNVSDIEIMEANQAMMVRGGAVAACSGCDNLGSIKPPPTKRPVG